jgi:1,4-alpha-glucan branching enzyme
MKSSFRHAVIFSLSLLTADIALATKPSDECSTPDEAVCKADKDERVMLYGKGREAYEAARNTGDFTEAYTIARQLVIKNDKNGERLMKMVYMQLGWGKHNDYVQAYGWLNDGFLDGEKYLASWREKLAEKMTPEQLAQAKRKAGN